MDSREFHDGDLEVERRCKCSFAKGLDEEIGDLGDFGIDKAFDAGFRFVEHLKLTLPRDSFHASGLSRSRRENAGVDTSSQ